MPSNKYIIPDKQKILLSKLSLISDKLQQSVKSGDLQTKEQYLFESIKVLKEFYKTLNDPIVQEPNVVLNDLPDSDIYNKMWDQIMIDLTIIFTELENIELLTVANFNFMTTESNRLRTRVKTISSKLGDYILYTLNPSRDAIFFKDSFNDLSKIDIDTALLNKAECKVNQEEGIITLPSKDELAGTISITAKPIINSNSNGNSGNNHELGSRYNGNIMMILDDNADTWYEYERVVSQISDDKQTLVLDMTINLGDTQVVNNIVINPNNFGTKTTVTIKEITTSVDGNVFISIKDDIPIAGFVTEDEENIFILAPSTSKFAGQGTYTFTPRKVKYIHIVFEQYEPYIINTTQGERLRYAIGIRDININAIKYQPEGEIISKPYSLTDEVRKVLIQTNQNPIEKSDIADISWFISPDDGQNWHQIQPSERGAESGLVSVIPEVITFNGVGDNNIITSVPVNTLRVKAELKREDSVFIAGTSSFRKTVLSKSELHTVPSTSPFQFTLEEDPVQDTWMIVDPLHGSRGIPGAAYTIGKSQEDLRIYRLPDTFKNFPWPVQKVYDGNNIWHTERQRAVDWLHVEIGGERWSQTTSGINLDGIGNKQYSFNPSTGVIELSAPPENATISIYFDPERLTPSSAQNNHIANLDFATSNNKKSMTIKRYDKLQTETELIPRGATVIRLKNQNITENGFITIGAALNIADSYNAISTSFVNGRDELTSNTKWSLDDTNGILYLPKPTPINKDISLTYEWQPIYILTENDWDWNSNSIINDSVTIKESAWKTQTVKDEVLGITISGKVIDLPNLSIVQGTFQPTLTISGSAIDDIQNPFFKEVKYFDGVIELGGDILSTVQQLPALTIGLNTINLEEDIITDITYPVSFTQSGIFADGSDSTPDADGEYYINRIANTLQVFSSINNSTPGTITYWYQNPDFDTGGLYSINNTLGRIHLQRKLDPNATSAWRLTVDYSHVDFRAEYAIARRLDPDDYDVDITSNQITIKEREVLSHVILPRGQLSENRSYYMVNYDYVADTREDVNELKDFFSPIIKDYAIKVLTKGKIF